MDIGHPLLTVGYSESEEPENLNQSVDLTGNPAASLWDSRQVTATFDRRNVMGYGSLELVNDNYTLT